MDLNKMISSVSNNEQVKGLMSSLVSKSGGLQGLMGKLGSGGLQDQVRSWIGTGSNEQVSAEQVKEAVGSDKLAEAAQQAGMTTDQAANHLAQAIPQLIDQATPEGSVPQPDSAVPGQGSGMQQDAGAPGQAGGMQRDAGAPGQAGGMQQDTAVPGQATGEQTTPTANR